MRIILVAFLGVCLACLASGCGGGGSNKVERPKNPAPVTKGAKFSPAGGGPSASKTAPTPQAPGATK
jgi:hypothetical protein